MNRKGISGLVIAVLLLTALVIICSFVMVGYYFLLMDSPSLGPTSRIQDVMCLRLSFKIKRVNITNQGVETHKDVTIVIENRKDKPIKGFLFRFLTEDGEEFAIEAKKPTDTLGRFDKKKYEFNKNTFDTTGTNQPFSNYDVRTNPIKNGYTIKSIKINPITDVTVDVKSPILGITKKGIEEVKCLINTKKWVDPAFWDS